MATLPRRGGPALSEDDHWRLAHRLLHDPDIATIDRVAGSFVLLYGQQLSRIAAMTRSQVHDRGDSLSIRFGPADVEIPEPLAGFVRAHLDAPTPTHQHRRAARQHLAVPRTPSRSTHHPGTARSTPRPLGIDCQTGRPRRDVGTRPHRPRRRAR